MCLDEVEKRGNVLFYSRSNQILLFCMIMYTYSAVEADLLFQALGISRNI